MSIASARSAFLFSTLWLAASACTATAHPEVVGAGLPALDPRHPSAVHGDQNAEYAQQVREVELARRAFAAERDARLAQHDADMLARVEELPGIPDLKSYLRRRSQELHARGGSDVPPTPELTLIDAAIAELGFIDCSKPRIVTFESSLGYPTVESEELLLIGGCSFGARQGRVWLVVNSFGGRYELEIFAWYDDFIVARMPKIEGVLDSDWNLQVVRIGPWWLVPGDGGPERSPLFPVKFRAKRDVQPVFGLFVNGRSIEEDLEDATHELGVPLLVCIRNDAMSDTGTYQVAWTCTGQHFGRSAGEDTWSIDLINGWTIKSLTHYRRVVWGDQSFIADPDPPAMDGSSSLLTTVRWRAGGDAGWRRNPSIAYLLLLMIEGPEGIPYAAGFVPRYAAVPLHFQPGRSCTETQPEE